MSAGQERHLHVMSVGISLTTNLTSGRGMYFQEGFDPGPQGRDGDYAGEMTGLFSFPYDSNPAPRTAVSEQLTQATRAGTAMRKQLAAVLDRHRPWQRWSAGASAELTSIAAGYRRQRGDAVQLRDGDTAVLIASDTADGLRAALFNAVILAGVQDGDTESALDRIAYFPEPSDALFDYGGQRSVAIMRIPGMDVGDRDGFVQAMQGLGIIGRGIADRIDPDPRDRAAAADAPTAVFHLSGGYKAAQPYVIGLAEALRGKTSPSRVDACVIHESSKAVEALRVPLKSLDRELLEAELAEIAAKEEVQDGSAFDGNGLLQLEFEAPPQTVLRGYACEPVQGPSGKWRLTPFGAALLELFRHEITTPAPET